jgi:3-phenylpropionate/cinnamic acid dioxygenase small subunit
VSDAELIEFVYKEAALLDGGRFDDWLALFAEDGRYWVPLDGAAQADARQYNSLAYEDRLLLQLRIERLKNPRAHSQHPRSSCQHVLQAPRVIGRAAAEGIYRLNTPFVYIETRGEQQTTLAGNCTHTLALGPAGLRIREKRVDLVGSDRPLPMLQLFP